MHMNKSPRRILPKIKPYLSQFPATFLATCPSKQIVSSSCGYPTELIIMTDNSGEENSNEPYDLSVSGHRKSSEMPMLIPASSVSPPAVVHVQRDPTIIAVIEDDDTPILLHLDDDSCPSPKPFPPSLSSSASSAVNSSSEDEELTSLSWLQDRNLLRKLGTSGVSGDRNAASNGHTTDPGTGESWDNSCTWSENSTPYNPRLHVLTKPPFSFSCLIFMAIEASRNRALPVKEIYSWIVQHFPYFQSAPIGWKNSVRHNLSLNKCFRKVEKDFGNNIGKGSLWCIDPDYRPNLLQALRKIPYQHLQFNTTDKSFLPTIVTCPDEGVPPIRNGSSNRALNSSATEASSPLCSTISEADAAATMLTLKNSGSSGASGPSASDSELSETDDPGNGKRSYPSRIVSNSPTEDHTYSAVSSPIGEDFNERAPSPAEHQEVKTEPMSSDESDIETPPLAKRPKRNHRYPECLIKSEDESDDEDAVAGADALLNLARTARSQRAPVITKADRPKYEDVQR